MVYALKFMLRNQPMTKLTFAMKTMETKDKSKSIHSTALWKTILSMQEFVL